VCSKKKNKKKQAMKGENGEVDDGTMGELKKKNK